MHMKALRMFKWSRGDSLRADSEESINMLPNAKRVRKTDSSSSDELEITAVETNNSFEYAKLVKGAELLHLNGNEVKFLRQMALDQLQEILLRSSKLGRKEVTKMLASTSTYPETKPEFKSILSCKISDLPAELTDEITHLPRVVLRMMEVLVRRGGLEREGILRVEGDKAKLTALIEYIGPGYEKDQLKLDDFDVNVLAAGLKRYIRLIPGGFLPLNIAQLLVFINETIQDPHLRKISTQLALYLLPFENLKALSTISLFLHSVAQRASTNKMDADNIAVVVGPTLFWAMPASNTEQVRVQNSIVAELIRNRAFYFTVPKYAVIQ